MSESLRKQVRRLTLDDISAADDLPTCLVHVPEWGGEVEIKAMTKAVQQRLREEATVCGEINNERLELLMVVRGVIDPPLTEEHYELLRGKSARAVDRINKAILQLNGMTPEEVTAAEKTFPN